MVLIKQKYSRTVMEPWLFAVYYHMSIYNSNSVPEVTIALLTSQLVVEHTQQFGHPWGQQAASGSTEPCHAG